MLERPAVGARPVDRAEQLVEQVAVAVLDVDEVEAGVGGERRPPRRRRATSSSRSSSERTRCVGGDPSVEHRVVVGDQRLRRAGRAGPAPGMRELQPDDQAVVASVRGDVRIDELGAQRREVVDGRAVDDELAWVGAPVVAARRRLHHPRRAWLRSRRSGASDGAPGRWVVRRARRPTLPSAAPRTGCRRCGRRPSRR